MRKVGIVIGVFVLVVGGCIAGLIYLTSGMTNVADRMFALVAQDQYQEAYDNEMSNEFKNVTTVEEFEYYMDVTGLAEYESSTWPSRSIENNTGEITGTVTTTDGTVIRLDVEFVKENGSWLIYAIDVDKSVADALNITAQVIPEEDVLIGLTNDTMALFADAVANNDFSEFYDNIANVWKFQTNVDDLAANFSVFMENQVDFAVVKEVTPTFTQPAYCITEFFNEWSYKILNKRQTHLYQKRFYDTL